MAHELYALNRRLGEGRFPRSATAYLDDWAAPGHGWLRKYYPPDSDEAHYDLAPQSKRRCCGPDSFALGTSLAPSHA